MGLSPNPYVIMDTDLHLVWMNEAYLRATMRQREDIIGRKMFDAFPSDPDTESFRQLNRSLRRVLDTGEVDEIALIRYDIARPDGGLRGRPSDSELMTDAPTVPPPPMAPPPPGAPWFMKNASQPKLNDITSSMMIFGSTLPAHRKMTSRN